MGVRRVPRACRTPGPRPPDGALERGPEPRPMAGRAIRRARPWLVAMHVIVTRGRTRFRSMWTNARH